MATGKRAGSRKGTKPRRRFQPALILLALGVTAAVVAWGYLVYAAIDFGSEARGGETDEWLFLRLASIGAVACLFLGLILVARLLRRLGITRDPEPRATEESAEPTTPPPPSTGGHRAAR